jgi:hypothetical protein
MIPNTSQMIPNISETTSNTSSSVSCKISLIKKPLHNTKLEAVLSLDLNNLWCCRFCRLFLFKQSVY